MNPEYSLRTTNADLEKERDAYKEGCESAKRGANEWQGKWQLNQTEKINLQGRLAYLQRKLAEAQTERNDLKRLNAQCLNAHEKLIAERDEAQRKLGLCREALEKCFKAMDSVEGIVQLYCAEGQNRRIWFDTALPLARAALDQTKP